MSDIPRSVSIHEEGPREGFQFIKTITPTEQKVELIDALSTTGVREIQTVSFVNPKRVPNMADAEDVARAMKKLPGIRYTVLWLNERGFQRAKAIPGLFLKGSIGTSASEAFMMRNQNQDAQKNLDNMRKSVASYKEYGVTYFRGGVSAAFGCNFAGEIPVSKVISAVELILRVAEEAEVELDILSLADTMGWATPEGIKRVVGAVRERWPNRRLSLHLHNTRGMGIANAYAGLQMGVDTFDAAVGGVGGCPFAGHKGAAGNVCTEDLVFMCQEMGIETGIDLDRLIEVAWIAERIFGYPLPGSVMRGGNTRRLREQVPV